jgi:succinate dehydrogenase/fumarate reductase-like Fe-S protein
MILSQANLGRGKMQRTETTDQGLCIHCGYIPVICREPLLTQEYRGTKKITLNATEKRYLR